MDQTQSPIAAPSRRAACSTARPAFTLLEVLLSASIGVLVMSALYVAMEIQLRQTQVGREVVEESVLVRSLLNRIGQDIAASLQAPPKSQTDDAVTALLVEETGSASLSFNQGVQGSFDRLELQVSRAPRLPQGSQDDSHAAPAPAGDLRRIAYWLTPTGLAREEVPLAGANQMPLDEFNLVIAPEVRSILFSYFDGTTWQESWDGTAQGADGAPKGPPLAIEIILEIGPANDAAFLDPDAVPTPWKRYRHVVALPTASLPIVEAAPVEPAAPAP